MSGQPEAEVITSLDDLFASREFGQLLPVHPEPEALLTGQLRGMLLLQPAVPTAVAWGWRGRPVREARARGGGRGGRRRAGRGRLGSRDDAPPTKRSVRAGIDDAFQGRRYQRGRRQRTEPVDDQSRRHERGRQRSTAWSRRGWLRRVRDGALGPPGPDLYHRAAATGRRRARSGALVSASEHVDSAWACTRSPTRSREPAHARGDGQHRDGGQRAVHGVERDGNGGGPWRYSQHCARHHGRRQPGKRAVKAAPA